MVLLCAGIILFKVKSRSANDDKIPPAKLKADLEFLYKQIVTVNPDPSVNSLAGFA